MTAIRHELGRPTNPDGTGPIIPANMGRATSELSKRWKALSDAEREVYLSREAKVRERFLEESRVADEAALAASKARRENLVVKDGEDPSTRGCRQRVEVGRKEEEDRKRRR